MNYLLIAALGLLGLATANAITAEELETLKRLNKADTSECLDFKKQSLRQRSQSSAYDKSLRPFVKEALTSEDKQKQISGSLHAAATENDKTVFVFGIDGSMDTRPGKAFRSEHRRRLESIVADWQKTRPDTNGHRFLVRFTDECEIPVVDWK